MQNDAAEQPTIRDKAMRVKAFLGDGPFGLMHAVYNG
jgi:hypothetical protein